ncbi:hypothetical protein HDV02_005719 [Globomyces sp. JEL0801]|nr:hypothetical protein HDV02_005719 [Globomyces sp. JEL0801]
MNFKKLSWLFALVLVKSESVLQSQWSKSPYCEGPPTAMYRFEVVDTSANEPLENEIWPPLYQAMALEYSADQCGNNIEVLDAGCCLSSLDLEFTLGWKSGSVAKEKDNTLEERMYNTASNQVYCHFVATNSSLFHLVPEAFILADKTCIDSYYTCGTDGEFEVYSEPGCNGEKFTLQLNNSLEDFSNEEHGELQGELYRVINPKNKTKWITYVPAGYMIPFNPKNDPWMIWDIFIIIQDLLTIIFFLVGTGYSIRKTYTMRKPFSFLMMISMLLWLGLSIHRLYFDTNLYIDFRSIAMSAIADSYLFGLTTLSSVFLTAFQFNQLSFCPKWMVRFGAIVLFILHVVFSGGIYFDICYLDEYALWSFCSSDFLLDWLKLFVWWIPTVFVWNILPSTLIVLYMISINTSATKTFGFSYFKLLIGTLWRTDLMCCAILLFQICLCTAYFCLHYITRNNSFMGNDKVVVSLSTGKPFIRAIHANLNCLLLERIPIIFKRLQHKNVDKSMIPSTVTKIENTGTGVINQTAKLDNLSQ